MCLHGSLDRGQIGDVTMPLDWEIAMGSGFSRLSVSGYRRLRSVDIRLRPLNVLIGANGVGKSSLLDVIRLLAAAAEGRLEKAVTDAGGIFLAADRGWCDVGFVHCG